MNRKRSIKFSELKLNRCPFLEKVIDGPENDLHIFISEAALGKANEDIQNISDDNLKKIISKAVPIVPNKDKIYELIFEPYIIYQVRNESYCSYDKEEIRHGKYIIVFEKSKLLEQLSNITDVCEFSDGSYYPDKWIHYGVYTQNHIIDVISHSEPIVFKINQNL